MYNNPRPAAAAPRPAAAVPTPTAAAAPRPAAAAPSEGANAPGGTRPAVTAPGDRRPAYTPGYKSAVHVSGGICQGKNPLKKTAGEPNGPIIISFYFPISWCFGPKKSFPTCSKKRPKTAILLKRGCSPQYFTELFSGFLVLVLVPAFSSLHRKEEGRATVGVIELS
jgi:hypothetical protein